MLAAFLDGVRDGDLIAPQRMAARLRVPMTKLSRMARVNRNTMAARPESPAVQSKLAQIARIVTRATDLAGDEGRALIWFRHQPIASFAGKTPAELVEAGEGDGVLWYLDGLETGAYD